MRSTLFHSSRLPLAVDISLLMIRLVMGSAFLVHGWGKIQHPLHWMGEESAVPAIFQLLAAISEFVGGLALILGLLSRLAATGLFFTMAYAVFVHVSGGDPFVGMGNSYEQALLYLVLSVLFLLNGAGRFSIDRQIFR